MNYISDPEKGLQYDTDKNASLISCLYIPMMKKIR